MIKGIQYYPNNGKYIPIPNTLYAQFDADIPIPCRKYHVSADFNSAEKIASIVLPILSKHKILHKVVQTPALLKKQSAGSQAGKFITIYMKSNVDQRNPLIDLIARELSQATKKYRLSPSPTVPKSRTYGHLFIEQPLDEEMFIYGGFVTDPRT